MPVTLGAHVQPVCNLCATRVQLGCNSGAHFLEVDSRTTVRLRSEHCAKGYIGYIQKVVGSVIARAGRLDCIYVSRKRAARLRPGCTKVARNFRANGASQKMQLSCNLAKAVVSRSYLPVTSKTFCMQYIISPSQPTTLIKQPNNFYRRSARALASVLLARARGLSPNINHRVRHSDWPDAQGRFVKTICECAAASRLTIELRAASCETASPRRQRASPGIASGPK